MDEGKFAADFLEKNLEKIIDIGKKAYGMADAKIQTSLKTAYKNYLGTTRLKYSKSKTFLQRDLPVELHSYYVPTSLECSSKTILKPDIAKCLEFSNRIAITGTGGSGKSILLKHLFLNCIQENIYVPVLIELRDLNSYEGSLDNFIRESIANYGFRTSDDYINNAKKAGHFCYLFDGYDEIDPKIRNKVIKEISSLGKQSPNCPILLSSRPDDVIEGLSDFSSYKMMPLNLDEALELIEKITFDETVKIKFSQELTSHLFKKHQSFLSNPLLLSIMLLTYSENAEIPSKLSVFYSRAFDALFNKHDARKDTFHRTKLSNLDSLDFTRVFSLFCVLTYEKRLFKMPKIACLEFIEKSLKSLEFNVRPDDYLSDLKSATCLMIEEGFDVIFTHRSFQEYFVALFISSAAPDIQFKLINLFWLNIRSDEVMLLLKEMNPELFERLVLIPKLEELFNEIKVVKIFGITHHLKLLKLFFIALSCDQTGSTVYMYANAKSYDGLRIAQSYLLKIVITDYSNWSMHEITQSDSKEKARMHKVKNLTIYSPVIQLINSLNTWYSHNYLAAGYEAYKKLKLKHTKSSQSFDNLLGI